MKSENSNRAAETSSASSEERVICHPESVPRGLQLNIPPERGCFSFPSSNSEGGCNVHRTLLTHCKAGQRHKLPASIELQLPAGRVCSSLPAKIVSNQFGWRNTRSETPTANNNNINTDIMAAPRRSGVATSSHINGYLDVSEMEKYKLVSNIGKGSFGVISKVQRVDDGRVSYGTRAWLMAGICS